jgi:subtilase family serine protease
MFGTRATVALIATIMALPVGALLAGGAASAAVRTAGSPIASTLASTDLVTGGKVVMGPDSTPSCIKTQLCPALVYDAYDLNLIVGAGPDFDGTNYAIGIVVPCGDPNITTDLATFDSAWGLPTPTLDVYQPDGAVCSNSASELETALDVEWAHAVAPGAAIDVVETDTLSLADLYNAVDYAAFYTPVWVISNSYGAGGACSAALNHEFSSIEKDGLTIVASSGDSGAYGWGTGGYQPQQPADCPAITSVGGTTLKVTNSGTYVKETGWSGSGGGLGGFPEPTWEFESGVPDPILKIAVPDVSADANPSTGVLVYDEGNGGWTVLGGTSVSCALWAGFLSDVDSWRGNVLGYHPLGAINAYLFETVYEAFGRGFTYAAAFHDITNGSNAQVGHAAHWKATAGWDPVTGLGSFVGANLDIALANDLTA